MLLETELILTEQKNNTGKYMHKQAFICKRRVACVCRTIGNITHNLNWFTIAASKMTLPQNVWLHQLQNYIVFIIGELNYQ